MASILGLPRGLDAGARVSVAIRPENVAVGSTNDAGNGFPARIRERRYQGAQTIYDIELLGAVVQAVELGTAARHEIGAATTVSLPPSACWAYPDEPQQGGVE